jgi:protein-tyrosine phosphatase
LRPVRKRSVRSQGIAQGSPCWGRPAGKKRELQGNDLSRHILAAGSQAAEDPRGCAPDVIDLHTHILPGLDDGPGTLEESLAIVALLADLGFDLIFLTPHFRQGFFESSASSVKEASEQLRLALGNRLPAVRFAEAHEVHLGSVFDSQGKVNGFLRLGSKQHVLLELPRQPFPFELLSRTIDRLFFEGIRVVLAHPEKYPELSTDPARYRGLCEQGVKFQLNITSLAGFAGRQARRAAEYLCTEGMVHAMGTDSHSLAHAVEFVPKGMRRALKLLGDKRLRAISEGAELNLESPGETHTWN